MLVSSSRQLLEVPILFELRKSIIYDGILAMEWGPESEELVNLSSYEAQLRGDGGAARGLMLGVTLKQLQTESIQVTENSFSS